MASSEEKSHRVETFDGSDPSLYRRWKRRAQLMLASLPTNVPEAKHGPRLMEFIKGEAEALLESIPVEELTKSGGDKKIWQALDDKYGPQPHDLMQQALKGYFYELQVKQSESYTQFLARYDAASRKLKEQGVELPAPVAGYKIGRAHV